jgi:hypothetical protein
VSLIAVSVEQLIYLLLTRCCVLSFLPITLKEKNPWLLEKMFESRFPEASGREEG